MLKIKRTLVNIINDSADLYIAIKNGGVITGIRQWRENRYWREKRISLGREHSDKTFYVIRRWSPEVGLFSYMNSCVTCLRYCDEMGYIPVVDLQHNKSIYLAKENVGKLNVWDMFFEQPENYDLEDIKKSKNIIINDGCYKYGRWPFDIFSDSTIPVFRYYCKKYIRFNKNVDDTYNAFFYKHFSPADRILGILCRGPFYTEISPPNHPIQPTCNDIIDEAERVMKEYNCNKIYLATEDETSYGILKNKFGNKLCSIADFLTFSSGITNKESMAMPTEQQLKIQKGINYAVSVIMLSKANCLIGGNTSGTIAARLLSDGYEYEHIYDLGRY